MSASVATLSLPGQANGQSGTERQVHKMPSGSDMADEYDSDLEYVCFGRRRVNMY